LPVGVFERGHIALEEVTVGCHPTSGECREEGGGPRDEEREGAEAEPGRLERSKEAPEGEKNEEGRGRGRYERA
ncbi:MAG: hypothetical protein LC667_18925, partial [Thioalkalivibrio sp.]|nr:hypothetical protein [Thioalkalivibrio sp.]